VGEKVSHSFEKKLPFVTTQVTKKHKEFQSLTDWPGKQ
jgi:hypothetical protein